MDPDQESYSTIAAIDDAVEDSEIIAGEQHSSRDTKATVTYLVTDSETMPGEQNSGLTPPKVIHTVVGDPEEVCENISDKKEPSFPPRNTKATIVDQVRELGKEPEKHRSDLPPQDIRASDAEPLTHSEATSGEQKYDPSPQDVSPAIVESVTNSDISSGEHMSDVLVTPPRVEQDPPVQVENGELTPGELESDFSPTLQSLEQPPVQYENGNLSSPGGDAREGLEFLRRYGPFLLEGLCEGCASILQSRLFGTAASGSPHHGDHHAEVVGEEFIPRNVDPLDDRVDGKAGGAPYKVKLESRLWSEEQSSTSDREEAYSAAGGERGDQRQESLAPATPAREIYISRSVCDDEDLQTPHHDAQIQNSNRLAAPSSNGSNGWGVQTPNEVDIAPFKSEDFPALTPSPLSQLSESAKKKPPLEERIAMRMQTIERKKDFICLERVNGRLMNTVQGLELHKGVFTKKEQDRLIKMVEEFQELGRKGLLRPRTFSEPRKWMPGKGRVTIQFGCCYNYATDSQNNPPGILREEQVDPLPKLLKSIIRRLVEWRVLPETTMPDSCIINIYDVGDCIPPHIDHHDFLRPFCTLSLLSECSILFGSKLKIVGDGLFDGPVSIPLPVGSVLVLNGKGADVAKHAVPGVPTKRISITFRKMDPSKVPRGYELPLELKNVKGLPQ